MTRSLVTRSLVGEEFLYCVNAPAPPARGPGCGRAQAPVLAGTTRQEQAHGSEIASLREPRPPDVRVFGQRPEPQGRVRVAGAIEQARPLTLRPLTNAGRLSGGRGSCGARPWFLTATLTATPAFQGTSRTIASERFHAHPARAGGWRSNLQGGGRRFDPCCAHHADHRFPVGRQHQPCSTSGGEPMRLASLARTSDTTPAGARRCGSASRVTPPAE